MVGVVGETGTVTVAVRGADGPGEVLVSGGGGSRKYIAYSSDRIEPGTQVVVYGARSGRAVDVEPLPGGAADSSS